MEVLVGVDACFLRGRPGGGVHARCSLAWVGGFHPVDQEGDGVFCGRVTPQTGRDAGGRRGGYGGGTEALGRDHRVADVDMVAVKVVGYVRVDAGPGLEGLELELGLRHVAVEIVEVAELVQGSEARVGVGRVVALVVLDVHVHLAVLLLGCLEEGQVMGEELDGGFSDHDVDPALDGIERDRVMGGVRGKDCDGVAGLEGVDGGFVGGGVNDLIAGEGVEGGVEVVVGEGDVLVKVLAYSLAVRKGPLVR